MMLFSYLGVLLSISFFIGSFVLFLLALIGVPIFTYRRIWRIWKIDKDEPNYKLRRETAAVYTVLIYITTILTLWLIGMYGMGQTSFL
jgi:hypothetical protein